jgi:hypothetical protein
MGTMYGPIRMAVARGRASTWMYATAGSARAVASWNALALGAGAAAALGVPAGLPWASPPHPSRRASTQTLRQSPEPGVDASAFLAAVLVSGDSLVGVLNRLA